MNILFIYLKGKYPCLIRNSTSKSYSKKSKIKIIPCELCYVYFKSNVSLTLVVFMCFRTKRILELEIKEE